MKNNKSNLFSFYLKHIENSHPVMTSAHPKSGDKRTYRVALPKGSVPGTFVSIVLSDGKHVSVQVPPQLQSDPNKDVLVDIVA